MYNVSCMQSEKMTSQKWMNKQSKMENHSLKLTL